MQKLEMIIQYTLFTLISSKLTVHCAPVHRSNAAPVCTQQSWNFEHVYFWGKKIDKFGMKILFLF